MKKKLLLMGNNSRIITDFFMQMDFYFECASTSVIAADLRTHNRFFAPDAVVYCMRAESRDNIVSVTKFVEEISKKEKIPFIVITDGSDYDFLCKVSSIRADLKIRANASVLDMQGEINNIIVRFKHVQLESEQKEAPNIEENLNKLNQLEAEINNIETQAQTPAPAPKQPEKKIIPVSGRPRILVVDDSTIIHKAIKSHLEKDYDIATAISGAVALRFLQTREVSLILLDYEMPEMNGEEVLKVLRANPQTADIPVIFLTGVNDTAKIQKVLALRPNGYLLKPVDKNVLLQKVEEILDKE